uniref:Uncharacterized protein n=1 Tax=Cannabis sativa TaxID=3483 RepID=A0A803NML8_CANSA
MCSSIPGRNIIIAPDVIMSSSISVVINRGASGTILIGIRFPTVRPTSALPGWDIFPPSFIFEKVSELEWRLMTKPNALVSRIYKDRYYLNGSFLTADLGGNPSFIWKSIFESQHVIKKGAAVRVGCGNTVQVLRDLWLPSEVDPYIHIAKNRRPNTGQRTFSTWLEEVYTRFVDSERRLISMVVWAIWKCRNDLVWDNKSKFVREVVTLATTVLNQWHSARDKIQDTSLGFLNSKDSDEHWRIPNVETIKVNTDAAIFEQSQCFSYSLVARNHIGTLEEARSVCTRKKHSTRSCRSNWDSGSAELDKRQTMG